MSLYRDDDGHPMAYESEYYGGPRRLVRSRGAIKSKRNWDRPQNKAHTESVKLALATRGRPERRGID